MVQYATLEEAWATSAPPTRYPSTGTYDVGKNDASQLDANLCKSDVALESAYPPPDTSQAYQKMHGSRSTDTLTMHDPRDPGCTVTSTGGDLAPRPMYAHGGPGQVSGSAGMTPSGINSERPVTGVSPTEPKLTREIDERGRLYDILVFVLFGLLIVLAMHEIAALGEIIGRTRGAAAAAARRAIRFPRPPRWH